MTQVRMSNGLGRIATGAAIGLMAGLALPHARKAVMQTPSLAAGDWVEALKTEHRMVEKLFEKLLATDTGDMVTREMLLTKIAYALNKHAIEEENVIYPALAEGCHADQSQHLTQDHAQVKTFIYDLRRISSRDPQWLAKAQEFWAALQRHIREEEEEIFPAFHAAMAGDENRRLTKMLNWEGFKVA
jgi:hemerythrin superfamily protein